MRESVPFPMERITACRAEVASMSRNCSASVPGGPTEAQVAPPSVVRRTVPAVPLTQATLRLTADSPRNRCTLPVAVSCHERSSAEIRAAADPGAAEAASATGAAPTTPNERARGSR